MQRQGLRGQVMGELAGQQGHGRYTPHWLAAFLDGAAAKNTAGADDEMLSARHQCDVGPGVEDKLGACSEKVVSMVLRLVMVCWLVTQKVL